MIGVTKPVTLTGCNVYLRSDPARITSEPYTLGWLFEGSAPGWNPSPDLLTGPAVRGWMRHEVRRMTEFVQRRGDYDGYSIDNAPVRLAAQRA